MGHFGRTLKLALRYRWTLGASFLCSVLVAVLWGGNISAVFPVVEVVLKGQSLHQWIDQQVAANDRAEKEVAGEIAEVQRQLAALNDAQADARPQLEQQLAALEARAAAERAAASRYRWLEPWIKEYLPSGPFQTLLLVIGVLLVGTLVKDLFLVLGALLDERLAQLTTFNLRKQFFRRTLRLDLAQFNSHTTGDLLSRFTGDVSTMSLGVQIFFGRTLREPLKIIVCLAGAAWICWRLLFVSLIVVPVAMLLIRMLAKSIRRASRRAMQEMSQLYSILTESFQGIKVVKAFTMERHERRRFHQGAKQYLRRALKIARYDALVRPLTELMGILVISLAILAGAYLVLNQETHLLGIKMCDRPLTLGMLLVFYGLLAGVSDPSRKLADVYGHLQRTLAAAERVYELLDREPSIHDPPKPASMPRHSREIVFDDVTFGYSPDQPILKNINLRIKFGETIAIVGPNGCGKTTLANLVPRFYQPQSGTVCIDGVDLRQVRKRDLRRQIGIVAQETLLFNDTIANNIRYGKPSATQAEIVAAAEKAHAARFIREQLDDGYETVAGAGGGRLSGGQRQRVSLARAILRDPAILILDEATSQIDLESEQVIHKVLSEFKRGRTTFIVTHRLSALSLADRIVVMNEGQIIDCAPHADLIQRCEFYRRLRHLDLRESA